MVKHPYVISMIDVSPPEEASYISYELAPNGDMFQYVEQGRLPLYIVKRYAMQLIEAIGAIH